MKTFSLLAALLLAVTSAFAEDPATFTVGAFSFTRPAEWKWVEVTSQMRKAQLQVPGEQPGDITFFHFGTSGGDVQGNLKRWFGQFQSAPGAELTEEQTYGKTKVTFAATEGTFASGMPGGPSTAMKDYALLGAILENPEGSVFVKFTGPAPLVKASRVKFIEFVKSAAEGVK